MQIDHIHFYVEDARRSRDWFIQKMGFYSIPKEFCFTIADDHTHTEVVVNGSIYLVFSAPLNNSSPIYRFLSTHPPGVVDVAFEVEDVEFVMKQAIAQGAKVLQPLQTQESLKWAQIAAWGTLRHTLVERSVTPSPVSQSSDSAPNVIFNRIDHVVLNVALGDLERAVDWYETVFGFEPQQMFAIKTDRSGLCSRVMRHPHGRVQLPINEPTSDNSQIQEFLDLNRGAGVQHIAIHTKNIVDAIAQLRHAGLSFLNVPATYYTQLRQRPDCALSDLQLDAIAAQQILVDWQSDLPEAVLLQTFTQPIFEQPTFFFELIERYTCQVDNRLYQAQGFGEGNFRALFEAIEREQLKRGSLKS
ncbi:MAG: 4-hydroxyphenylpyruvate dioxygenase [Phormidesmis sp. CAN_BIN36]|nr:4-hydroxyphenylpyruvate dioxygenase [Phormidesmis sp. CAN_BIN36]